MNKFLQKSLFFTLSLLVASSTLLQPLSVKAQTEDSLSLRLICTTNDVIADILTAYNLGELVENLDGPWYNPSLCSFHNKVFGTIGAEVPDDQLFGERYTYAQINWITHSLLIQTLGRIENMTPLAVFRLFAEGKEPTFNDFAARGPMGVMIGSISEMVNRPPASGVDSVKSTLAKFDFASPAQAQGYGYTNTSFLQPLWTASRNMAYAIIVILLIASGFLVMFRVKVNPQTAVSLQLMIPRIVITLIAVTFSYAIAGFVIDLMYLLLSVFIGLLSNPNIGLSSSTESITFFATPGFGKLFSYYLDVWNTIGWAILVPILGPLLGFVVTLVILFLLFKVFWMMLKTYLTIMFLIIVGPWQIMLGILPGQSGFGTWFRNIVANVSVFAVVPVMFIFNMIFWDNNNLITTVRDALWDIVLVQPHITPPSSYGTLPAFPLFGSQGFIFNFAIGYAILALIPKTADMIKEALKTPAFKHGTAFGEALGPARTITGAGTGFGRQAYSNWSSGLVVPGGSGAQNFGDLSNTQKVLYTAGQVMDRIRR